MRVGFLGPCAGTQEFKRAAELLFGKLQSDFVVYLGLNHPPNPSSSIEASLGTIVDTALSGTPNQIRTLSAQYKAQSRWSRVHCIPEPPAQAIEMVDDRIVVILYNKAHLDEDDVFNATLVVYGNAPKLVLNKFGHRLFFCPGPFSKGRVGVLSTVADGPCKLEALDMNAHVLISEALQGRVAKMSVS